MGGSQARLYSRDGTAVVDVLPGPGVFRPVLQEGAGAHQEAARIGARL